MRQIAHHHGDLGQPVVGQVRRELDEGALARVREGLAQDEVLGRIAGEGHLGEHDEVDAVPGGLPRPGAHQVGVALEVTDAGVDLGQAHPQLPGLLIGHVAQCCRRPGSLARWGGCLDDHSRNGPHRGAPDRGLTHLTGLP